MQLTLRFQLCRLPSAQIMYGYPGVIGQKTANTNTGGWFDWFGDGGFWDFRGCGNCRKILPWDRMPKVAFFLKGRSRKMLFMPLKSKQIYNKNLKKNKWQDIHVFFFYWFSLCLFVSCFLVCLFVICLVGWFLCLFLCWLAAKSWWHRCSWCHSVLIGSGPQRRACRLDVQLLSGRAQVEMLAIEIDFCGGCEAFWKRWGGFSIWITYTKNYIYIYVHAWLYVHLYPMMYYSNDIDLMLPRFRDDSRFSGCSDCRWCFSLPWRWNSWGS